MVAELTESPSFDVTNPKVIKTSGEITSNAKNQIEVNLFSLLAQMALIEFATIATITVPIIYPQI